MGKLLNGLLVSTAMLSLLPSSASLGRDPKVAAAVQPASLAFTAKNLQVLPRDTAYAQLILLMTGYSQELGVQCVFCHTQNPRTEQIDFSSDESPAKLTARIMIGMVRDINGKYLAQVSDQRYAVPITCGNCHRGQTFPPAYEAKEQP
jgi:Photosynthetic reaction centre cytochrome C subunit